MWTAVPPPHPPLTPLNRYRKHVLPEWPDSVEIKFILAHPPVQKYAVDSLKRLRVLDELKREAEEHGDMVILDVSDARRGGV